MDEERDLDAVAGVERTGVVRVEVGGRLERTTGTTGKAGASTDGAATALVDELSRRGIAAKLVHPRTVEVDTFSHGEAAVDVVRDAVADLELRLYSLSSRRRSLDDLFLEEATHS